MAGRIDNTFKNLASEGRSAFVAYICAGDPSIDATLEIVKALEKAGADLIELGIPFSDPLADGVVNQMAAQRALEAGAQVSDVLSLVKRIREISEIPLVSFTYLNPVYTYGFQQFHEDAAAAGVDGILILDLPPDELGSNEEILEKTDLESIHLIAPTTPAERIAEITSRSEGFIYYVSREGVTGAQTELSSGIEEQVRLIKSSTEIPVAVGFGISTPEQAAAVARHADGVVVGSAIVNIIAENGSSPDLPTKVHDFVKPLVDAVKEV